MHPWEWDHLESLLLTVGHFGSSGTVEIPLGFLALMSLAVRPSADLSEPVQLEECLSGPTVAWGLLLGLLGLVFLCGFGFGYCCGRSPKAAQVLLSPRRPRVGASALAALHQD